VLLPWLPVYKVHAQTRALQRSKIRLPRAGKIGKIMAKFVVAGKVDCAAYARAELLADQLQSCLPDFHVHKVPVPSAEWAQWVREECEERGWVGHCGDVLVWRELVKRGGRGVYVGGVREFQDYASHYHNVTPLTDSVAERNIAEENRQTLEANQLEVESRTKPHPLRVAVTSASSFMAYHLLQRLALGDVFGDKLISLRLLDTPTHSDEVSGVAMEITDMASPSVESVHCTSSVKEAFQLASVVFVLEQWEDGGGDIQNGEEIEEAGGEDAERKEEEEEVRKNEDEGEREEDKEKEKDGGVKEEGEEKPGASETSSHLEEAATLYQKYGATLDFCAQKSVRVIVSGRLSNLGAAVIARTASSIPRTNIIAAPSLVEQRSKSVVAGKLRLNAADVEQVCVWGRCGGGEGVLVDVGNTRVHCYQGAIVGPDPFSLPLAHCLHDPDWLASSLLGDVRKREREERGGGGLSEAVAIAEMVRQWMDPNNESRVWCSVGVVSEGDCYGFPEGVVCSVPARREGGEWKVVQGLEPTPNIQEQLLSKETH
ncbi:Putative malate dehydrogenase 1B, partial [Geodia barretti]